MPARGEVVLDEALYGHGGVVGGDVDRALGTGAGLHVLSLPARRPGAAATVGRSHISCRQHVTAAVVGARLRATRSVVERTCIAPRPYNRARPCRGARE